MPVNTQGSAATYADRFWASHLAERPVVHAANALSGGFWVDREKAGTNIIRGMADVTSPDQEAPLESNTATAIAPETAGNTARAEAQSFSADVFDSAEVSNEPGGPGAAAATASPAASAGLKVGTIAIAALAAWYLIFRK